MPLYKIGLHLIQETHSDVIVYAKNEKEAMAAARRADKEHEAFDDAICDMTAKTSSKLIVDAPQVLRHPSETIWIGGAETYGGTPNDERHLAAVFYGLDEPKEVEGQKADKEWAAYRREAKKLAARFNREKKTKPAK